MRELYVGVDLGTTGCKCLVFDQFGKIYGDASAEYELLFTEDGVEQDAQAWWSSAAETIRRACTDLSVEAIHSVSVSTQGISGVPVGRDGACLSHALSWLDTRSAQETEEMVRLIGKEKLFYLTGKMPYPYSFPQLVWIRRNDPVMYQKIWKYMLPLDFLNFRLTGVPMMDYSIASGTMAFDMVNHRMIPSFFKAAGINADLFSPVRQWGEKVGRITVDAARETGLVAGTPVILGAQDQRCAALGAGIAPGVGTISLGTSSAVCSLVTVPETKAGGTVTCCAVDDVVWMLESVINTSGAALKWAQKNLFTELSYQDVDMLAEQSPPGANGVRFIPDMEDMGQDRDGNGSFTGMTLRHTRADLARAVLEGIAFRINALIREQTSRVGAWKELRLFGGGAKSMVWCQMIADMTGLPVRVPSTQETGALGAAMIAAAGTGAYADVWEASHRMRGEDKHCFLPDAWAHEQYCQFQNRERMRKES